VSASAAGTFDLPHALFYLFYRPLPFTALSLPLFVALGIVAGILKQNRFAPPLYSLLLVFWWILQGISCRLDAHITVHVIAAGLMCFAVSSWYSKGRNSTVMGTVGILLVFGGLIVPSFLNSWWGLLYRNPWNYSLSSVSSSVYIFWVFALPVIDILILLGLCYLNMSSRSNESWERNMKAGSVGDSRSDRINSDQPTAQSGRSALLRSRLSYVTFAWATSIFVLWLGSYCLSLILGASGDSYSYYRYGVISDDPWALAGMLAVNVLIVWLAVGLIWSGLKRERGGWFWYGVVFFMLWAIIRYVDLFSEVGGMLGAAAIFLFCGLFMFGIVYVWTTRRRRGYTEPEAVPPVPEFTIPAWMIAIGDKISPLWRSERNILTAVIVVALIQFGILGAMIGEVFL